MGNIKNEIESWAQIIVKTEKLLQEEKDNKATKDLAYKQSLKCLQCKINEEYSQLKRKNEDLQICTKGLLRDLKQNMENSIYDIKSTTENFILKKDRENMELDKVNREKEKIIS